MLRQPKFVWIFRAIAVELCCTFRTGHLPFIFNKSEVADMDHLVWSCSAATRARRVYGDRTLGCGGDQTGSWPSSQQSLANYKAVPPQVYSSTPATIQLSRVRWDPLYSVLRLPGQPRLVWYALPDSSCLQWTHFWQPARPAGLASQFDALLPAEIFDPPARHRSQLCGDCKQQAGPLLHNTTNVFDCNFCKADYEIREVTDWESRCWPGAAGICLF